jgi:hypothetical protein
VFISWITATAQLTVLLKTKHTNKAPVSKYVFRLFRKIGHYLELVPATGLWVWKGINPGSYLGQLCLDLSKNKNKFPSSSYLGQLCLDLSKNKNKHD